MKKKNKTLSRFLLCTTLVLLLLAGWQQATYMLKSRAQGSMLPNALYFIKNQKKIVLEIADTPKKRAQGLMYRSSLPADYGMIFIYPKPQLLTFWMKNTLIPLDLLFLKQHQVVAIFYSVPPCPKENLRCPTYTPPLSVEADHVIELNAGTSKALGIAVGEKITLFRG